MTSEGERIQLAHGGGGRLSREFVNAEILPRFGAGPLRTLPDAATLTASGVRLVFTTDSYVVQPLEFPGGNIGHLAVYGTVNDIAVSGGRPCWLSLALILEEGLDMVLLRRVLDTIKQAADQCGVIVVTGDTKVVGRGQCDGMFVTTSGIGMAWDKFRLGTDQIAAGDSVLVSGPLGDHGMAVLAARNHMDQGSGLISDSAPVHRLVEAVLPWADKVRFMRDPTRGGLAAVLNEIIEGQSRDISLTESALPFSPKTRALAEVLGIDPLHVASEGRMVLLCDPAVADVIMAAWRALPEGRAAARIGSVVDRGRGRVIMETIAGGRRLVDVPRGELLPRIC